MLWKCWRIVRLVLKGFRVYRNNDLPVLVFGVDLLYLG
jgi:hypothetical protein